MDYVPSLLIWSSISCCVVSINALHGSQQMPMSSIQSASTAWTLLHAATQALQWGQAQLEHPNHRSCMGGMGKPSTPMSAEEVRDRIVESM